MTDMAGIALVTMIIWVALFVYIFSVDRKVKKLDR